MLAMGDGIERELGADVRIAGGVDHHVDQSRAGDGIRARGDGDLALLDGTVDCGGTVCVDRVAVLQSGEGRRGLRLGRPHLGHGPETETGDAHQLHHQVGAHLAAACKSDGNGSALVRAGLQFGDERRDPCDHLRFMPFLAAFRPVPVAARRANLLAAGRRAVRGMSRRSGGCTAGASPSRSSPGCFP